MTEEEEKPHIFCGCLDSCCPCDLDEALAYRMPQYVYIQHRTLGCLQYLLTIVVLLYIGVYELWFNNGYMSKESPSGISRLSTMRPKWSTLPGKPSEAFHYCCDPAGAGTNGCSPGTSEAGKRQKLPCLAWSELEMTVPNSEEHSAFIATRVSVTEFSMVDETCSLNINNACRDALAARTSARKDYYTTDPEGVELMMQHTIYAEQMGDIRMSSGNFRQEDVISATMKKENGEDFMNFCVEDLGDHENMLIKSYQGRGSTHRSEQDDECRAGDGRNWLRQQRSGDILSIGQLLQTLRIEENSNCASGLDCPNYLGGDASKADDPYRYDGISILIPMIYSQARGVNGALAYHYEPKWIRGREWEENYKRQEWSEGMQTDFKYHGVRVQVVQVGQVGTFSFIELLKTFVGGMGLMALAGFLIERVIMKLPCWGGTQNLFERYAYIYSHDLSSVVWEENPADPDVPIALVPTGEGEFRKLDDELFTRGETRGRYQGTAGDVRTVCCGLFRAAPPPGEEKIESKLTWWGAHKGYGQVDQEPASL